MYCMATRVVPWIGSRGLPAHSLSTVPEHSPQWGLRKAELLLDHPIRDLPSGADIRFGSVVHIIKWVLRRVWQHSGLPGSYGDVKADPSALHFGSLLNSLVAGIRIDHRLLAMPEVRGWGEVMHSGSGCFHWVDEAAFDIHANVDLHPVGEAFRAAVVALLVIAGLVHLRIPLLFLFLSPPAHSGFALVEVELGAAIKVPSKIVPCFKVMPLAQRWALMPRSCFSILWRNARIVVSSGIRLIIRATPAKRRIVATSINAPSIAGSLRS
jgi:hypothetical protein